MNLRRLLSCVLASIPFASVANAAPPSSIFQPAQLQSVDQGRRVQLRIATTSNGCTWGDYDAIQLELQDSKNKRLLVSLEPIGVKGASTMTTDITSFDLEKGFVTTYQLPASGKPQHYGLYICKDSDRTGSCGGKPATDVQAVLESHLTPMDAKTGALGKRPETKQATDKTYYFAYLLADGNNLYVMKNQMQESDYATLGDYLKSVGAPAVLAVIRERADKTLSVQPVVKDGILSLTLPQFDKTACGGPK
ncbi:MAG: hypothetical protein U0136_05135 [Bdellovibrionota bacterium]